MAEDRTPRYVTLSEDVDESKRTVEEAVGPTRKQKPRRRRAHPSEEAIAEQKEKISSGSPPHFV